MPTGRPGRGLRLLGAPPSVSLKAGGHLLPVWLLVTRPGSGLAALASALLTGCVLRQPLVFGAMVHRDEAFETIFSQYVKITSASASGGDS